MIKTLIALKDWERHPAGLKKDLGNGFEVWLEVLIFDQQWYLAIYKDQELVAPKVVVKIGYE